MKAVVDLMSHPSFTRTDYLCAVGTLSTNITYNRDRISEEAEGCADDMDIRDQRT